MSDDEKLGLPNEALGVEDSLWLATSKESRSNMSSCSHLMNVSLDPAVSLMQFSFRLELPLRLDVLNFFPEDGASLKGLPPLIMDVRAGVIRSWRLVPGEATVVLQVLNSELSSLGILSTLVGVLGEVSSAMVVMQLKLVRL